MEKSSLVKILMVDDRAENLFALTIILSNENYLCVKANSGKEALKILKKEQDFAIILMDVQMPEMDGFETVELIRQVEKLKHVPIIFLTASMDTTVNIFKGYSSGAVDYMIKPLSPEILKAKVAVFVDLYRKTNELQVQKEQMKLLMSDILAQKELSKYSLSLIEASHDPLFAISPKGKITDTNNASLKVLGLDREKLIGSDFFDYFTEPQKAREVYQAIFANEFVTDSPLTLLRAGGQLTDVLFNGSVYKDETGNVLGAVVVARDITDQKRIANELIEAMIAAELATGIAEQAKAKAESATQIAVHAVKAKQQFLSNMSHEIRTPMNAIIGFTKVILKTDLTDKQKDYLNAIKLSGDALIVLINDILDLAKVDAGKMTFEHVPFKMALSISAMLHIFETKIQEKNLELVTQYDKSIPEVLLGDPIRLHQIILNLVSNAVKFTTHGKITVGVRMLKEDEEKVTIEFAVSDTGIGIPESKLGNIFDDFQQATSETSRLYGGTGLGLAIVKQLVEPQGGFITVKSEMGKGSTFSFILNFHKTNAKAEVDTDIRVERESSMKNIKVLVVEDIPLNQLLMKTLLEDFGFELDIAPNGKIAVDMLLKNNGTADDTGNKKDAGNKPYDIILMDLQMPEMNGFEATAHIRNVMKLQLPIIALTADVTTVDVEKCKAVGMNDYLSKPIDDKLLYRKIINHLKITPSKDVKNSMKTDEVQKQQQEKYINLDYLKQRTKSNPKLITEMISLYLGQTPLLISTMKKSLEDKNWDLLSASVHKMIPSFSIVGMHPDYEKMAKKIQEDASAKRNIEELSVLVNELEKACTQACEELKEEMNVLNSNVTIK